MKILLIHNRYTQSGGEDTVFDNEVQLLRENGNEVEKIIFTNREVHTLSERVSSFVNSIFSFTSFFQVQIKIDAFKPDIVHIHNLFYTASPSVVWAARSKKVPVVMTLHNYRLLCPGALFLRDGRICVKCRHKTVPYWGVFHRCFKNSLFASLALTLTIGIHKLLGTWRKGIETFITLTPFASDLFENSSLKLRKKQISIKPNWTFVTSIPTVKRGASFLFVGRLSEEKGIPFLLQTFKENGLTLQIVGDGPLREKVKTIKSQNIIWLGSRSREQVLKFMSQSKAIVFSSCCYEMFPLVIIEAFATGTPVIAPSLGSIPNIIEHKKTGLLYAPNDSRDFVKQLNLINSNPTLYDCLLTLTRQEYFSKYCPERAFSNLITIYRDLVPTLA